MSSLIVLKDVAKRHGAQTLFENISLSVLERERLGIIGPNGTGKSTLLRMLAGFDEPDSGSITRRKSLRVSVVDQSLPENSSGTALELAREAAGSVSISEAERETLARTSLGSLEIDFEDKPLDELSGGQRKRVQLALALCESPELLLLDEPTNHLDIETVLLLEEFLKKSPFAWITVSHDRFFLENSVNRIAEVNPCFVGGMLTCEGSYGTFLERREAELQAAERQADSMLSLIHI